MSTIQKNTFTELEAAEYLGLHPTTLRKARMEGHRTKRCPAPPFVRLGRAIRYLRVDLDKFLNQHRVDTSSQAS